MSEPSNSAGRLGFIDWTRGFAAVVMIQGHTFDSFARSDLRDKDAFLLSQFAGGLPPAMFLFLTGITFAFLMHSQDKKETNPWKKIGAALKRSRYLFLIAFLFRIQLFFFGFPQSPINEIWKVDILNCMGFAMLLFAPMAVFNTLERARLCSVLGLVIACLAPVMTQLDSDAIPWVARAYLMPNFKYFGFFPWAAYLAFGMAAGSILRLVKHEDLGKLLLWTLALGVGCALTAQSLSNLPYSVYAKSDFWLNSPGLTFSKLGVVMSLTSMAYLWVNLAGDPLRWSYLRQLGTTSLIVYWVHIELVYGRWFGFWKQALSTPEVVVFTLALLVLMWVLSIAQTRFTEFKKSFRAAPAPQPASGD
jgi:uncharacterized membrane protein